MLRQLLPALRAGLLAAGSWVSVGLPFLAGADSSGSAAFTLPEVRQRVGHTAPLAEYSMRLPPLLVWLLQNTLSVFENRMLLRMSNLSPNSVPPACFP